MPRKRLRLPPPPNNGTHIAEGGGEKREDLLNRPEGSLGGVAPKVPRREERRGRGIQEGARSSPAVNS